MTPAKVLGRLEYIKQAVAALPEDTQILCVDVRWIDCPDRNETDSDHSAVIISADNDRLSCLKRKQPGEKEGHGSKGGDHNVHRRVE